MSWIKKRLEKKNNQPVRQYRLASAWLRIGNRFIDLLIVIVIVVVIYFIFFRNLDFNNLNAALFFGYTLIVFLLFNIYFLIIPFFTKGYTLVSYFLKIRIYSTALTFQKGKKFYHNLNFFFLFQLFLRELFLWYFFTLLLLILGITAFFLQKELIRFLKNISINLITLFNFSNSNMGKNSNNLQVYDILFQTGFTISTLLNLITIISVIISNKKRSIHDHFSQSVVVNMKESISDQIEMPLNQKRQKQKRTKLNLLPGEINSDAIDET